MTYSHAAIGAAVVAVVLLSRIGIQRASDGNEHARSVVRRDVNADADSSAFIFEWFLTPEEISAAMGEMPRANLPAYTTGNHVAMLVDGSEVLGQMYKEVTSTDTADKIFGSFWSFGGTVLLTRRACMLTRPLINRRRITAYASEK